MNTRTSTRLPLLLLALLAAAPLALRAQSERSPIDGSVPSDANRGTLVTPQSAETSRGDSSRGGNDTLTQSRRPGDPQALRIAPVPDPPHHNPVRYLRPDVWTTRNAYQIGDSVDLYFRVNEDAYVYIFNTDTQGRVTQIFPNYFDSINRVRADRLYRIPDRGYSLQVQGPPGVETIHILAVSERYSPLRVYEYYSRGNPFPSNVMGPLDMLRELDSEARRGSVGSNSTQSLRGRPDTTGRIAPVPDPPSYPTYQYGCAAVSFRTYERRYNQPNHDYYYYNDPRPAPAPPPSRDATLRVNTSPTRARVYLDGDFQGLSPLTIETRPGEYELLIQKQGYKTEVRTMRLGPNEDERISLRMEKTPRMWFWPRNR